jgi:P27 family predicted phage terminase small subunit
MGRPRKPTALKALEGNPGRRDLNAAQPVCDGAPERPNHVQGYATTVWNRVIESMPDRMYSAVETELLASYCVACAEFRRAVQFVEKEGAVLTNVQGNAYVNPWMTVQNKQAELIAKHGGLLGLDPSSRSKLQAPEPKSSNKFSGLIAGRTA